MGSWLTDNGHAKAGYPPPLEEFFMYFHPLRMQMRNVARHFHLGNCIIVCSTVLELGDYTRSSVLPHIMAICPYGANGRCMERRNRGTNSRRKNAIENG